MKFEFCVKMEEGKYLDMNVESSVVRDSGTGNVLVLFVVLNDHV